MFSMQSVSYNPLIATFQLSSAGSLNFGWSQNVALGLKWVKNVIFGQASSCNSSQWRDTGLHLWSAAAFTVDKSKCLPLEKVKWPMTQRQFKKLVKALLMDLSEGFSHLFFFFFECLIDRYKCSSSSGSRECNISTRCRQYT